VFHRLPLPYVNEDFNIDSTIRDFAEAVYKPPPYTSIRRNVYLIKKKRIGVRADTGCTNCRADSTCKEDCECRGLSMSCSKNCRCSDLCTNRPFRKDKKIKIVKVLDFLGTFVTNLFTPHFCSAHNSVAMLHTVSKNFKL